MKGKVTSLILVSGAFLVAAFTQSSSSASIVGSHALSALIVLGWFVIMGTGLYFWAKHTRQPATRQQATRESENFSLQQLAQAVGPAKGIPAINDDVNTEQADVPSETQKNRS